MELADRVKLKRQELEMSQDEREIKIPSKRPQRNGKIYMITEYRETITAHPEQFRSRRWSGQHLQRHGLQESFHS